MNAPQRYLYTYIAYVFVTNFNTVRVAQIRLRPGTHYPHVM